LDSIVAASPRSESVAGGLESGFPGGFQRVLDHRLEGAVPNRRDAEGAEFAADFRYVHPLGGFCPPWMVRGEFIHQLSSGFGCLDEHLVNARGFLALIHLRYSPNSLEPVGVAAQHELLQGGDLAVVPPLGCPKDAASQIAYLSIGFVPVDMLPVGQTFRSVCAVSRCRGGRMFNDN